MNKQRRRLLASSAALAVLQICPSVKAQALPTSASALTTAAIAVKTPEHVVLIAIAVTPGNRLVAVGEHGVIIYSNDNGGTWHQAQVPVDLTLTCVQFATAEIGWAAGHFGAILKTEDGGATWVKQLDGDQVNQLTLQAAQNPDAQQNQSPAAALAVARAQHFADAGSTLPFLTMIVFNSEKVLVLGAYRFAMLTNDGGKSWQDWSLNIYYRTSINIYDAAQIGSAYYLAAEQGLIFCSKDGGNSFLPLSSPGDTSLFGVLGGRDGSVLVFGVAGNVFRSTNAGVSWTTPQINVQDNLTAGRVLKNGDILLASEAGQMYVSNDDGQSFTPVLANPTQPLFGIQGLPGDKLIGVGPTGVTVFPDLYLNS